MTTGNEPPVPADPPPDIPAVHGLDRPRNARGNFVRSIDTVRRDAAAADYLATNPGTTYRELAELFGYADKSMARKGVLAAKADVARPAVTKLIRTESAQLDDLYLMATEVIEANHVVVSHGKVVTMRDPESGEEKPLTDHGPKLQAIQTALRIRESYRKLHGLDQPAQVAVSGTVKYEVVGVDPADLS
ncbi:hypothetical protein [Streptomyces sp. STCH 565 A]|uniref:hypothetical protein n=1 Tax=Streptomyces sp. STCH 565 A TaxID=2950532 RepID=UPI002075EC61|nr:hypothetical protein [Streptomyces sp. STCH 565 A]MCM8555353.1 hypothetical protein [Streptomyces sp. STCH 565 A]